MIKEDFITNTRSLHSCEQNFFDIEETGFPKLIKSLIKQMNKLEAQSVS